MRQVLKFGSEGEQVEKLQAALNKRGYNLFVDGIFGDHTERAVMRFQAEKNLVVDGIVGKKTYLYLFGVNDEVEKNLKEKLLKEADLQKAAENLKVDVAVIKAINYVESRSNGFILGKDKKTIYPSILFERHIAYKMAKTVKYGLTENLIKELVGIHPDIFNPHPGGYRGGFKEYERVKALNNAFQTLIKNHHTHNLREKDIETICLESCSYGLFQIMGFNYKKCGFNDVQSFVLSMEKDEGEQLKAFCNFILNSPSLFQAIKTKDWKVFAYYYNGPNYKRNNYDLKLQGAFEKFKLGVR